MRFSAVTTFAPHHWESYAKRCVASFEFHWPKSVPLCSLVDEALMERSAWLGAFKQRHAQLPIDNYRKDAVRFAHKIAAIDIAFHSMRPEFDALIWIDADCITHSTVDEEWLESLIGDADFGYLDRKSKYPECGFMIFRTTPQGRAFVHEIVSQYVEDLLFKLPEWHDSFVIEAVRKDQIDLRCASLSGNASSTGHPFVNGPLGSRMDHLKGKRKRVGRSFSADLKSTRIEDYWKKYV